MILVFKVEQMVLIGQLLLQKSYHAGKVFRVIHPVGHILKGSGFYRTDYRGDDYSKKKLAEERPAAGPACDGCNKKGDCGA